MLPNESKAVTVKLPATPAVVGDGKPATTNVLAAPGAMTKEFEAASVGAPVAVARSVYDPAFWIDRSPKLAMPFTTVALVVPNSVPPLGPLSMVRVTLSLLSNV